MLACTKRDHELTLFAGICKEPQSGHDAQPWRSHVMFIEKVDTPRCLSGSVSLVPARRTPFQPRPRRHHRLVELSPQELPRRQFRQVRRHADAALVELEQLDLLVALVRAQDQPDRRLLAPAPSRASPASGDRVPSAPCRRPWKAPVLARRRPAGGACGGRTADRGRNPRRRSRSASAGRRR